MFTDRSTAATVQENQLDSCLYVGEVTHCRRHPVEHRFRYRMFMWLLDLSELETVWEEVVAIAEQVGSHPLCKAVASPAGMCIPR